MSRVIARTAAEVLEDADTDARIVVSKYQQFSFINVRVSSLAYSANQYGTLEMGIGSCLTFSMGGFFDLLKRKKGPAAMAYEVEIITMQDPGDHAFLCLNRVDPGSSTSSPVLDRMSEWPDTAVICDPWAGIVCRPNQFQVEWNRAMDRWYRQPSAKGSLPNTGALSVRNATSLVTGVRAELDQYLTRRASDLDKKPSRPSMLVEEYIGGRYEDLSSGFISPHWLWDMVDVYPKRIYSTGSEDSLVPYASYAEPWASRSYERIPTIQPVKGNKSHSCVLL